MPFIPAANTVQVELFFQWNTQRCENVFYFEAGTVPNLLDMPSLLDQCRLAWSNNLRALIAPTVSLVEMKATDLSAQTGFVHQTSVGLPMSGTSASASLPNNCSLVMTKRTALRGRSFRGRTYIIGLTEALVTDNIVVNTFVTAATTWLTSMSDITVGSNHYFHAIVSRQNGGVARNNAVVQRITGITSDGSIDSQRRRLPGRGA